MNEPFLAFSDLHSHPFPYGAHTTENGLNSRLVDTVHVIDALGHHAKANKIEHILFAGDLTHVRGMVATQTLALLVKAFTYWGMQEGLTFHMIPGNHDQADKAGVYHTLSVLSTIEGVRVYDVPKCSYIGAIDTWCVFVPYIENKQEAIAAYQKKADQTINHKLGDTRKLLLTHAGINGATVGSDFVMISKDELSLSDIVPDAYDAVLMGHYHEHQKVGPNAWYIGAPLQHNWADAGCKRGFLECWWEGKELKFKQIEIDGVPKFHVLNEKTLLSTEVNEGDFVTYVTNQPTETSLISTLLSDTPATIEIKAPKKSKEKGVDLEFSFSPSTEDMLVEWIKHNKLEGVKQKELLQAGKAIMAEVQSWG